jgi:hypothetical protein
VGDGAASLLVGLLLIGVAVVLLRRDGALLIGEAAPADVGERLRRAVARGSWVAEVAAVDVGPRHPGNAGSPRPVATGQMWWRWCSGYGVAVGCCSATDRHRTNSAAASSSASSMIPAAISSVSDTATE